MVDDCETAIEAKATDRVRSDDLSGLRELKREHPTVKKRLVISMEAEKRLTEDKILILPYLDFVRGLWDGDWF